MVGFEFYDRDEAHILAEYVDACIIRGHQPASRRKNYSPRPAALLDSTCYRAALVALIKLN